jgi:hypothetical protein
MVVWGEGGFELRRAERWTVERRRFERRGTGGKGSRG